MDKVLIANRGVIACRIIRTLRRMGIGAVAVYSEADGWSLHVRQADEAVGIGPAPEQMRLFGLKHTARAIAAENGVPLLPGTGLLATAEEAADAAAGGRSGRVPAGLFTGDGERLEHRGGSRGAGASGTEADRAGSNENGDRHRGAGRRGGGEIALCAGSARVCRPTTGDAASGGLKCGGRFDSTSVP